MIEAAIVLFFRLAAHARRGASVWPRDYASYRRQENPYSTLNIPNIGFFHCE
jgi:hypothetical protein